MFSAFLLGSSSKDRRSAAHVAALIVFSWLGMAVGLATNLPAGLWILLLGWLATAAHARGFLAVSAGADASTSREWPPTPSASAPTPLRPAA